jgi:hypothetical protein
VVDVFAEFYPLGVLISAVGERSPSGHDTEVVLERKGIVVLELRASKGRLPSFYLLLVFFSLTAAIVVASDEALYQAKAGGRSRIAYAVQAGRGSRVT